MLTPMYIFPKMHRMGRNEINLNSTETHNGEFHSGETRLNPQLTVSVLLWNLSQAWHKYLLY